MPSLRLDFERPRTTDPLRVCHCDDAFQAHLEPHLALLHSVARGMLHSPDLACDAVQEALYALWTQAQEPADLRAWLVRTTVHKCLHVLRREGRRIQHEERAGSERSETCPLCDPTAPAEAAELRARLDAAIAELSDEQRTTFLLRAEQGLEYQEIAAALRIPIGTVRSRLKRARESLAQRLAV